MLNTTRRKDTKRTLDYDTDKGSKKGVPRAERGAGSTAFLNGQRHGRGWAEGRTGRRTTHGYKRASRQEINTGDNNETRTNSYKEYTDRDTDKDNKGNSQTATRDDQGVKNMVARGAKSMAARRATAGTNATTRLYGSARMQRKGPTRSTTGPAKRSARRVESRTTRRAESRTLQHRPRGRRTRNGNNFQRQSEIAIEDMEPGMRNEAVSKHLGQA